MKSSAIVTWRQCLREFAADVVPSGFAAPKVPVPRLTRYKDGSCRFAVLCWLFFFGLMRHLFIDMRTSSESSDDGAALVDGASCKAGGLEVGAMGAAENTGKLLHSLCIDVKFVKT